MATTCYFEKALADTLNPKAEPVPVEVGTTNGSDGKELYINFGDHSLTVSHEDAEELIAAMAAIGRYFGYKSI
jgi:hypothetical protein